MVVQGHPRSESACNFSLVIKSLQFQHNLGPISHRLKNVAGILLKTVMIQTDKRTDRIIDLHFAAHNMGLFSFKFFWLAP